MSSELSELSVRSEDDAGEKLFVNPLLRERRLSIFPFRKQAMPFSRHLKKFLTINKFFSTYFCKEKRKHITNHPVSNLEPLFPTIPLKPLH